MAEKVREITIVNEEIDYIVRNYKAVNALMECLERAKNRVPIWLVKKIVSKINRRIDELPNKIGNWHIEATKENDEINIFPGEKYYDREKEIGMYFGIENIGWDNIVAEYEEDGLFVYLYYYPPDRKRDKWKEWEATLLTNITKKRPQMLRNKYNPDPNSDDNQYIVSSWLYEYINIETLNTDINSSINLTIEAVFKFINHNMNVLIPLPY